MFEQIAFEKFLKSLENIECGKLLLTTPNGKEYIFEGKNDGVAADIIINDYNVIFAISAKGDVGFAEAYKDKKIDTSNLVNLMNFILANQNSLSSYIYGTNIYKFFSKILYLFNQNTISGSKKNIHAHYDIGNSFYKLWLDETMTYSSAIFTEKSQNLALAQNNKYDRILDRIATKNASIIEIGCGWGGFAERAIEQKNHHVRGITISEQQHKYAVNRLQSKGDNAKIIIEDYRKQTGKFDNIVSIEMFEAVGEKYWKTYFDKLNSLLKQKGKAIVQTITIADNLFEEYRKSGDFIRSYIFPGGMLPSVEKFTQIAEKSGLKVSDKFNFGQDYATTLERWLENFDNQIVNVKNLGFDEQFIRIWRLYLATCIASFTSKRTDVVQMELVHA